jgi:hypothetical protein
MAAAKEPLLNPLLLVMDRRIISLFVIIRPALQCFGPEEPLHLHIAALVKHFPLSVWSQIRRREQNFIPVSRAVTPAGLGPIPEPAAVLDELWQDPDPDTALWALWVQLRCSPERGARLQRQPRIGLSSSPALDKLRRGEGIDGADLMDRLLRVPLVTGLSPAALFSLVRWGERRSWQPGEALFSIGDPPDSVAILLEGGCEVRRQGADGPHPVPIAVLTPGEAIGEVSFFTDQPRQVHIQAGSEPVDALVFSSAHFEQLLQQSSEFSRGLLHQLALKIEGLYGDLGRDAAQKGAVALPRQ